MDYEGNRFPERGLIYKLRSLPSYFWGASDLWAYVRDRLSSKCGSTWNVCPTLINLFNWDCCFSGVYFLMKSPVPNALGTGCSLFPQDLWSEAAGCLVLWWNNQRSGGSGEVTVPQTSWRSLALSAQLQGCVQRKSSQSGELWNRSVPVWDAHPRSHLIDVVGQDT